MRLNTQKLTRKVSKTKKSAFTTLVILTTGLTILSVTMLIYRHTLVTYKTAQNTRDYLRSVNQMQVNSFRGN